MDDEKFEKLYQTLTRLENRISRLSNHLEEIEYIQRKYGFMLYSPRIHEFWKFRESDTEEDRRSLETWIKQNKRKTDLTKNLIRQYDVSPQDLTIQCCIQLMDTTSYLAAKSLLGVCNCGGQIQLLVKDNTVYLTCAQCGRWLWQGLKHE